MYWKGGLYFFATARALFQYHLHQHVANHLPEPAKDVRQRQKHQRGKSNDHCSARDAYFALRSANKPEIPIPRQRSTMMPKSMAVMLAAVTFVMSLTIVLKLDVTMRVLYQFRI